MRATGDRNGRPRRAIAFDLAVLLGLVALFVANLCLGSVETTPAEVARILAAGPGDTSTAAQVIWQIRLPRAIEAVLLGGALSLSGFLLQTFFANPIADPFVLGVSSGAKLVVAVMMIVVLGAGQVMSPALSVGAAFAGSLLTMGFVLAISRRVRSQSMLIVAGVMVGYICSAVTNFLVAFADDQSIVNLDNWSRGSFSGATWSDVGIVAVAVVGMGAAVFALSKPLGAYQLGEAHAQSVGVNVRTLRMLIVLVSSLLSACVAAFAGPVSFVGIAAPHLARRGVGSSRPLLVTPACFLTGAVFCCGCDLIARTLFSPVELSVSAVTAVFGAPIVIALMLRGRSAR
ncbi:FecCD family ABC transporter permease [Thermophilibacter provencensis]|uniref:Iron ABC transporter permease n=1 Tax=Thermophilibacter provencensis TaxID=1852386 RepID=A0ABT7V0S8_9ACTN|nr:iron ABC transporter permease [Thermophilibacter provencensis]MDM8270193.1 iron ABC transporter permease [Thermophilibacter provencensis]